MRTIGLLCGAGTLLYEAQEHGIEVVGSMDTRPYFRNAQWVWDANFDAPFAGKLDDLEAVITDEWFEADIALGHPPCGSYSNLGYTGASKGKYNEEERAVRHEARAKKKGLVPLFVELVNRFQPKTFALDNLIKLMKVFPPEWWEENLPGYKLTFLTIVNWDYGSPQERKRLWVIGSRGKKAFSFKPPTSRLPGPEDGWEAIRDLPWQPWLDIPELTHFHHFPTTKPMGGFWVEEEDGGRRMLNLMSESALGFMSIPHGYIWPYITAGGRSAKKAGQTRIHLDRKARTPTGNETLRHPLTGWPLTVRERARLMGWPDGFILSTPEVELNRTNILKLVRVTGRAVPSEFPRYLIPQLAKHARRIT